LIPLGGFSGQGAHLSGNRVEPAGRRNNAGVTNTNREEIGSIDDGKEQDERRKGLQFRRSNNGKAEGGGGAARAKADQDRCREEQGRSHSRKKMRNGKRKLRSSALGVMASKQWLFAAGIKIPGSRPRPREGASFRHLRHPRKREHRRMSRPV